MIANDLLKLIAKYNESGFFVFMDGTIYWFNGKRYIFWEYNTTAKKIIYVNNRLYGVDDFNCVYEYKHKSCENFSYNNDIMHSRLQKAIICASENTKQCGNFVYVFGNLKCKKYDIKNKEWINLADKPLIQQSHYCDFLNDCFYVFHKTNVCVYNITDNNWKITHPTY